MDAMQRRAISAETINVADEARRNAEEDITQQQHRDDAEAGSS